MHRYGTDEEIGRVLSRHGFDKALKEMGIDAKNPPNIRAARTSVKLVCGCVENYSLPLDQWKRTRPSLKERH